MGASPLMSLGMKAMAASYAAMQATGHNISNANVAGYSRQQAEFATSKGQFTGAGFFGKGVDVKTVTRAHDEFLTRAAANARALASMDEARSGRLVQLQQVFATGEGGIGYAAGQFLNSMVDLAARPSDSATRQVVLARAQDLQSRFNGAQTQLDVLQAGVTADLKTSVEALNGLARSVAEVNQQIAAVRGVGQPPNDLLDERDRLVSQISAYTQVSTLEAEDGTLAVFIGGGQRLVLGVQAVPMKVVSDPDDPSRSALALQETKGDRVMPWDSLGGGSLAGLLRFQNEDLVDGRNYVGQMAAAIAGVVNAQQELGLNLQQPARSKASQPLFDVGDPVAVPNAGNAKNGDGSYVSSVQLTVVDASALQAADYSLRADGNGQYIVTRLSKPQVEFPPIDSGAVIDGMRITIPDPAPPVTDSFLLKPVAAAAGGLKALLSDPLDLAAASPLIAAVNPDNRGTATVAQLSMVSAPQDLDGSVRITFTDDEGGYLWERTDIDGNVVDSDTGTWTAGGTIPAVSGRDMNGFSLALSGVPRSGDTIDIRPTPDEALAANNGNALALAALREISFVGRTMATDGTTSGGTTATDAYASAMAAVGVRVQSAKASAAISGSVSQQAEAARASTAGVNLDEEAARLIQFQQSYQAAAKVLQIAQSVFETLLQTTT